MSDFIRSIEPTVIIDHIARPARPGRAERYCRKFCNWLNPVEKTELFYPANE